MHLYLKLDCKHRDAQLKVWPTTNLREKLDSVYITIMSKLLSALLFIILLKL